MEGKTVILSVFVMSLVMAQTQVEATNLCCPSEKARNIYTTCRFASGSDTRCAQLSGCKLVDGTCPGGYNHDILENLGNGFSEYCKLGCASSVCNALTALQNSDASEIVNGAVEKCTEACSTFCTKGSKKALETTV